MDAEEGPEDFLGRKKSKIKSLKSRLFSRSKRADAEETAKLSQSASDITAGEGLGSDEDLACSQGMMGSRAFSHDSIFLAEIPADSEPTRVLSQENVHSKIKALQMKLQLQKMHLGPPPMVLPVRCPEEASSRSEDDLLQSSREISGEVAAWPETLAKSFQTSPQPASSLFSPIITSTQTRSLPPTPSHPTSLSVPQSSSTSTVEAPLDFSTPAQFSTCLDTSAARHRMSIKPRNQRASTKKKPSAVTSSGMPLPTLNSIDFPDLLKDQEELVALENEVEKTDKGGDITPSHPPLKSSSALDPEPKPRSQSLLQQDRVLPVAVPSQVLRTKPSTRTDAATRERPHSSFIESEPRERRELEFGKQVMFLDKKTTPSKSATTETSPDQLSNTANTASRSSCSHLWPQGEDEGTKGIKRPALGTGSFKFSISTIKTQDEKRPRSTSFAGVLEQTEARQKPVGATEEKNVREKEEAMSFQVRGSPFAVGRLRQEGEPSRTSVVAQDRKDTLKNPEPVSPTRSQATDTGAVEAEEMESSQELVEEAEEAKEVQEDEGKTAFGVKLRATTQSFRYRSETSSSRPRPLQDEDQGDKQRRQEVSNNIHRTSDKITANTSPVLKPADPAPSGVSLPAKHQPSPPPTNGPHAKLTEVQKISSNLRETQAPPPEPLPAPQASSSEVSWMSLAMEKTRSLQQLFTSRFPRDFTQTSARTQAQPPPQPETRAEKSQQNPPQNQAAVQPPADEESGQSRSQAQTVKPSSVAAQQKMMGAAPVQSNTKEPQTSKQTKEDPSQPVSPGLQANPWTALSPLRSASQAVTTSSSAPGNAAPSLPQSHISSGQQQQPPWTSRCPQPSTQLKPTPSAPPVSADSAWERGEREASMREGPSPSVRRAVWTGSVGERAAFLEKRAEWTSSPSPKGVELKKPQAELQTSGDASSPAKTGPQGKDASAEGRPGFRPAESNPTRVPDKPREDRWLRKNVGSPSSSPTQPSVLASMSESGQPSWMELAKRKSMAWSDKTMD